MLDGVRGSLEVDEALYVPGIVDARVRRVLADEGLGRVGGRLAFAGTVICVNQVETGLARLIREREAGGERLVLLDRGIEVVRIEALMGFFVEHLGAGFGQVLAVGLAAGRREQDHAQREHAAAR